MVTQRNIKMGSINHGPSCSKLVYFHLINLLEEVNGAQFCHSRQTLHSQATAKFKLNTNHCDSNNKMTSAPTGTHPVDVDITGFGDDGGSFTDNVYRDSR